MTKVNVPHLITAEDAEVFERPGFTGRIFVPKEALMGFNAILVDLRDAHPAKQMIDTTRVYFIVSGRGVFEVNGLTYDVAPEDLIVIQPGDKYSYAGKMKLFEFNISPDNSFQDKKL